MSTTPVMGLFEIRERLFYSEAGRTGAGVPQFFSQESALWPDMLFLRCIVEQGYIVRVAENVAQYLDVSSSSFPVASLDFVQFNKALNGLHVYRYLDRLVQEARFDVG